MSDAAGDSPLSQEDVDAALAAAGTVSGPAGPDAPSDGPSATGAKADSGMDAAGRSFDAAAPPPSPPQAEPLELPDLLKGAGGEPQNRNIDLLRDVDLHVKIELGRSRMFVEDVLRLAQGSVVELDKLAGDPVDVLVNEKLVARGEVLVLNDNFCVRINEILSSVEEVV